jgi:NADP-dependent 3-hydroxy acid dehydrogenase YdfG
VRTAIVTGASAGFGAAIAHAFGELGWQVAVGARRIEKLGEVAREVERAGGRPLSHVLDVADPESIDAFVRAAEDTFGAIDVVVNNAGVGVPGLLHEVSAEGLRAEIETNLVGPLMLVRRVLPGMLARMRGDIVFVSSLNATLPRPFQVGYTATKAGIEGAARALQMELEGTGVRATIVRPGPSRTEMGSTWDAEVVRNMLGVWKRFGILRHHNYLAPESIARAVLAAVTAPPGTHLDLIQVNPEGPIET